MEATNLKCEKCRFPVKMCQCKNYSAIRAREDEKKRQSLLSRELRKTASQNSHNGNINVLKDTYFELRKKGKDDSEWKSQLYNSSLKSELAQMSRNRASGA